MANKGDELAVVKGKLTRAELALAEQTERRQHYEAWSSELAVEVDQLRDKVRVLENDLMLLRRLFESTESRLVAEINAYDGYRRAFGDMLDKMWNSDE